MQAALRQKRNDYLLDIVGQFKQSEEEQNIFNCYDYVKIVSELSMDSFIESLSDSEKGLINGKTNIWFIPIESIKTFSVFLSNNDISGLE